MVDFNRAFSYPRHPCNPRFSLFPAERIGPRIARITRMGWKVSQAIFARLLGVSRILVQKWEAGDNTPSPMARRLMDTIKANPPAWLAAVREAAVA